jgi:hypothetical protein
MHFLSIGRIEHAASLGNLCLKGLVALVLLAKLKVELLRRCSKGRRVRPALAGPGGERERTRGHLPPSEKVSQEKGGMEGAGACT